MDAGAPAFNPEQFCQRLDRMITWMFGTGGQTILAGRIGVTRQQLNGYVTGKAQPNLTSLLKIANGLNVTVDFLLTGEHDASQEPWVWRSEKHRKLSEALQELPESVVEDLLNRAKELCEYVNTPGRTGLIQSR